MKRCGGRIEGGGMRSQLMSWFESTKPFFFIVKKRGFLSSHQLSLPFAWKLRLRFTKKKKDQTCMDSSSWNVFLTKGTTKGVILTAIMRKTIFFFFFWFTRPKWMRLYFRFILVHELRDASTHDICKRLPLLYSVCISLRLFCRACFCTTTISRCKLSTE